MDLGDALAIGRGLDLEITEAGAFDLPLLAKELTVGPNEEPE
jgi:hypothetical protein